MNALCNMLAKLELRLIPFHKRSKIAQIKTVINEKNNEETKS